MTGIIDYGVGNLFSLRSSFAAIGRDAELIGTPEAVRKADRLVLPGVGAFEDAARLFRESGLADTVLEEIRKGKPLLGICLGMQLLFDESLEYGRHRGLGIIPGTIRPLRGAIGPGLKIPHIGWNALRFNGTPDPLFARIRDGDFVYFVHSYYADTDPEHVLAYADYGIPVTAAVRRGNVYGCQFHPEKSGQAGLNILRSFCETEAMTC